MGRFGPAVKRLAGDQTDVGLIPLHLSALFKRCASTDTNTTGTMQEIFRFYAHYLWFNINSFPSENCPDATLCV